MSKKQTIVYKWLKYKEFITWDEDFKIAYAEKAFKVKRFLNFVHQLREKIPIDSRKVKTIIDLYIKDKIDIVINEASNDFDIIKLQPKQTEEQQCTD